MRERFDEFFDRCLYDPEHGFYARHGSAGRTGGDFITSPEVGPLFGAVVARYLDAVWTDLGQPGRFTVVEAGAGRGALARAVFDAAPACATVLDYVTVERSDRLRAAQAELLGDRVRAVASLDEVGGDLVGVVLANELLDNLAVRLAVRDVDGWGEVYVDDGVPLVLVGPVFPAGVPGGDDAPVGARLPLCEQAAAWVRGALDRLAAGRVLVVDYGVRASAELVGREWLRTYRGHERGADPFEAPGRTDITVDVPFDQLPPGATIVTQAEFLDRWGIHELVDEGRRVWAERAHLGDLVALRARSRVREADALLDPDGLGGFLAAEWVVA